MAESIVLSPPPVFFIKSISEQGYSLSTAIADLIDNSLAAEANRIELLIDPNTSPLRFFIADNGCGMSGNELTSNMRFPSADLDEPRSDNDLGRFGLGLKTASFSQARRFSLISSKDKKSYEARTWDVEYLKETQDWTLMVENEATTNSYLQDFETLSLNFHARNSSFEPSTIVIWDHLYKLEKLQKKSEINDELEELRSHIGLVFHRFIKSGKVEIRLNNLLIDAFDPFPVNAAGVQLVAENYWQTVHSFIRFQGIILPKRSAIEAKEPLSQWAPQGKTLDETQGMFIYRNDRLISYGGWLRTIPKSVWLQFGRIRIDITNSNDSEFHLNVAKSSLKLPFGLRRAMAEMVSYVASQAAKEYRERMASNVIRNVVTKKGMTLILRENGAAGPILRINQEFDILRQLQDQLNPAQLDMLNTIIGLIENKLNQIWKSDINSASDIEEGISDIQKQQAQKLAEYYKAEGYSKEEIRDFLLESFGQNPNTKILINTLI
ncbi:ATP-binding protein [Niabella sp.]|uniref:ATP-binding protein n=1 Tax=Niabella sp. TaxID=1962976 RepID=UPI00261B1EF6|nr:ATP-binding protein [Niabella sp.]